MNQQTIISNQHETGEICIQFCQTVQLFVNYLGYTKQNSYLIDKLSPILVRTQFTSLNITGSMMFPNMIIELIHLLPNLDLLSVSYLSLSQSDCLSIEDTDMTLYDNKIQKVRIEKMNEIDEVHFFINLCPRMEYFEIGIVNDVKLELVIRTILTKNTHQNRHFCSLCFDIRNANDDMVQRLQTLIKLEKLLYNYSIKRTGDQIYLKWK
jgi:hypothetical protein